MEIQLTRGKVAIVDDQDVWLIFIGKWHAVRHGKLTERWYASTTLKGKAVYMHRLILDAPKGLDIDHINGDGLDNRRENLRIATRSQNMRNAHTKPKRTKTSQYKGVSWWKQPKIQAGGYWKAEIELPGRKRIVKYFHTEVEAARHYDQLAREHFGEHARINGV